MPQSLEELRSSEHRQGLLNRQLGFALMFYEISEPDTDHTRRLHRAITQQMAFNAVDLALPHVVDTIRDGGLKRIALDTPLRGALAIITQQTVEHLRERLRVFNLGDMPILLWAQGVKRHPQEDYAEMYFRSGYDEQDIDDVYAIIADWGTATGLTNEKAAQDLYERGLPHENIMSLSMTLATKGEERLIRSCPGIHIEAATRAGLNEVDYVDRIAHAQDGQFVSVTPKDWGAKMWGMENPDNSRRNRLEELKIFMRTFATTYRGFVSRDQLRQLYQYYYNKYVRAQY